MDYFELACALSRAEGKRLMPVPKRFKECAADNPGKIYFDYFEEGIRVLILRGPASVNCYLGIPSSHPLAGFSYDDLPVECHGGLTFGKDGTGDFPNGFYWYGYDYSHAGDMPFYELKYPQMKRSHEEHPWTPEEVKKDAWSAIWSFKKLMNLAETIAAKVPK